MARPHIEPVTDASLDEFAQFLHENLSRDQSPAEWSQRFRTSWIDPQPNYGFVLRDEGRIVGGIGCCGCYLCSGYCRGCKHTDRYLYHLFFLANRLNSRKGIYIF